MSISTASHCQGVLSTHSIFIICTMKHVMSCTMYSTCTMNIIFRQTDNILMWQKQSVFADTNSPTHHHQQGIRDLPVRYVAMLVPQLSGWGVTRADTKECNEQHHCRSNRQKIREIQRIYVQYMRNMFSSNIIVYQLNHTVGEHTPSKLVGKIWFPVRSYQKLQKRYLQSVQSHARHGWRKCNETVHLWRWH